MTPQVSTTVTQTSANRPTPATAPDRASAGRAGGAAPDDGELARRTAGGDQQAAGELVERYQGLVRAFLRKLTGRPELADDLAQETFLRMLRHADRYDPQYPMRTWLLTIARRLSINLARRADSNVASTEYLGMDARADEPSAAAEREDDRRALRDSLESALAQLTEPQRAALVLFHQQEMSVEQVAQMMEMPVGTIKSHLHRGRAAMRKVLGERFGAIES